MNGVQSETCPISSRIFIVVPFLDHFRFDGWLLEESFMHPVVPEPFIVHQSPGHQHVQGLVHSPLLGQRDPRIRSCCPAWPTNRCLWAVGFGRRYAHRMNALRRPISWGFWNDLAPTVQVDLIQIQMDGKPTYQELPTHGVYSP